MEKKPTTYETYQAVEKDELVLCLFDLDCSAVFSDVSQYNGMISPAYNVFKIKNQHEKYFKYLFDYIFQDRTYKIYSKSIRYTITEENFNNLETPVPPISEQIQIANYLDWKINEIDKLILIEKEQIKELENLKQKYIDEIYQNIKTKNFISLSKIGTFFKGGGFSRENLSDSDYGAILYGDIYTKYNYFFEECISKIDENAYFNSKCIDGNVVLFTGSGETKEDIGKSVAYVGTKKIALGGDIIALKPNKNFFSKFIAYFSNTSNIKAFKHMESTGDIIVHITLGAIKAIKIPFISVEEQKDIVKKIDEYILNLKNLIALIEDKIKYFLSLKQSLIAEVVTGKIDVRNIAIPQYEKVETTFETDNIDELEVQDYGD
ncbi:restriction endonuclease subunit S [Fusobacterium vincentii]|uniref:restriction endonuclease subunit S n=1 Tax=Fusobacterium vincentii TaxID=155615 RepID=UPI0030D1EC2C